jgi:hypothetical protein
MLFLQMIPSVTNRLQLSKYAKCYSSADNSEKAVFDFQFFM